MFRIEFFVDDKKLPAALIALTQIARGAPTVTPVVNAVATKGNGIAAAGSGNGTERFIAEIKKQKLVQFDGTQAREILKSAGLNPASANHFLKEARNAHVIRKYGKGSASHYKVM